MPARIPLDPALPKNFDCTPNEKRSKAQLDAWGTIPMELQNLTGKFLFIV